jgi:hypothetical protein
VKHSDFKIGMEFMMSDKRWRCTDIGKRTIAAIELSVPNESWYNGPPYAVAELVIDEDDIEVCEPVPQE